MAPAITDKFVKVGAAGTATQLAAPGHSIGGTSINVGSTTNWPTDTAVVFAIRQVDAQGELVAGTYTEWMGIVSGTTITNLTLVYGTDQIYPAATTTQVYIPISSYAYNRLIDALLTQHKQNGTHGAITADSVNATSATFSSLTVSGAATSQGWSALGQVPNTVTPNGNRNFDLVFNGVDLTSTLTQGMKLQIARTAASPNQCTSLNGSTQYYSKASPNKLTFTDDFVVSAWVKLSAYSSTDMIIASRYNGTSGWQLLVNSTGQVKLSGFSGGAANESGVISFASLPLNKWVHVAAQLDMSTFTATTTTSYVMFDGLDVPAVVSRGGTNPTSLTQAGNLEIGTRNGGLLPFSGKIAQVAIYNAKVTQATIRASMDRGLVGTETSLASAYSFSNSIADLNTTTPNDLTANGSAVATNADSPFGNGGVSTTLEYAEINSAVFSTNTTVNVRVSDACQIPSSGGVASVNYSTQSNPYGLPVFSNIIGMAIMGNAVSMASSTRTEAQGAKINIMVPPGRAIKLSAYTRSISGTTADLLSFEIHDGSVSGASNMVAGSDTAVSNGGGPSLYIETVERPNTGSTALSKTYVIGVVNNTAARSCSFAGELTNTYRRPLFIKAELA